MTEISPAVDTATIMASFIAVVKNPVMASAPIQWSTESPPVYGALVMSHHLLGSSVQPNPTWPTSYGSINTTNVYFILYAFALQLTRHRQAKVILRISGTPETYVDLGFGLTSHIPNSIFMFDMPNHPDVGEAYSAATMNTFLTNLRAAILAIKPDTSLASDLFGSTCHSSCHSSCHGARGRR